MTMFGLVGRVYQIKNILTIFSYVMYFFLSKINELSLCNKLWFSNSYIFATQYDRYFKILILWYIHRHRVKCHRVKRHMVKRQWVKRHRVKRPKVKRPRVKRPRVKRHKVKRPRVKRHMVKRHRVKKCDKRAIFFFERQHIASHLGGRRAKARNEILRIEK